MAIDTHSDLDRGRTEEETFSVSTASSSTISLMKQTSRSLCADFLASVCAKANLRLENSKSIGVNAFHWFKFCTVNDRIEVGIFAMTLPYVLSSFRRRKGGTTRDFFGRLYNFYKLFHNVVGVTC